MKVLGGAFGAFAVAALIAALLLEGPKSSAPQPTTQAAVPAPSPAR